MSLTSQASRRYAEALLEAVQNENGDLIKIRDELSAFASAKVDVFDLRNVLENPSFTAEERTTVLDKVMGELSLSAVTKKFLKLVTERDRIEEIDEISATFASLADERAGKVRAVVETASELSGSAVEQLTKALEKGTGRKIELEVKVDTSLIGGVRTLVGSVVYDGTIRAELDRLRLALNRAD